MHLQLKFLTEPAQTDASCLFAFFLGSFDFRLPDGEAASVEVSGSRVAFCTGDLMMPRPRPPPLFRGGGDMGDAAAETEGDPSVSGSADAFCTGDLVFPRPRPPPLPRGGEEMGGAAAEAEGDPGVSGSADTFCTGDLVIPWPRPPPLPCGWGYMGGSAAEIEGDLGVFFLFFCFEEV